jgi:putative transposase
MRALGMPSIEDLRRSHTGWVEEAFAHPEQVRESKWTESIAVGSRDFVVIMEGELGMKANGRRICGTDDESALCEPQARLRAIILVKNSILRP